MRKKQLVAFVVVAVIILAIFIAVNFSEPRKRVYIRPNGNVEPASAPIQQNGNNYTFAGDVYAELVVQKGNILIDGGGYTLHGPYNGTRENLWVIGEGADQVSPGSTIPYSVGVDLGGDASGLTITNLNIKNFSIGTYIWTENITFVGNTVSECVVAVLLSGSENSVTRNYMVKNEVGLFFGSSEPGTVPLNLTVSHNSFNGNVRQLGGCLCQDSINVTEPIHTWDDGREGNYWSDYNGTDVNGDGIGDTAYVFDVQNEDRYPLMTSPVAPPTVALVFPVYTTVLILIIVAVAVVILGAAWNVRRKRSKNNETPESSIG